MKNLLQVCHIMHVFIESVRVLGNEVFIYLLFFMKVVQKYT